MRFTKISDVSGFSPIDVKTQPWCNLLQPSLKRHQMFEEQQIYSPVDIVKHLKIPLATRIEGLLNAARKGIGEKVSGLAKQDKRQAEKSKARMEAQLEKVAQFLKSSISNAVIARDVPKGFCQSRFRNNPPKGVLFFFFFGAPSI